MRPPPPLAAADEADVVFEGRPGAPTTEGMRLRTSFEVLRTFKGEVGPRVELVTMASSAACGRSYVPGETYLVYASAGNGGLGDNLCSRTRRSSEATVDFAALGSGLTPTEMPTDADVPNLEPPRIEPTGPAALEPPANAPHARSCAVSVAGLPHAAPEPAWALLLLVGVASLRRRAYRGRGSALPRKRHVARIVRNPAPRQ